MKVQESLQAKGELKIQLFDKDGNIKEESHVKNLVVNVGRNYIAARMKETGRPNEMSHMEIGQGTAAPTATDTTIGVPFTPAARVTTTSTVNTNQVTYTATFPATVGTGPVTEAGIFNASTGGIMLCRTRFDVINKAPDDILSISWVVSIIT